MLKKGVRNIYGLFTWQDDEARCGLLSWPSSKYFFSIIYIYAWKAFLELKQDWNRVRSERTSSSREWRVDGNDISPTRQVFSLAKTNSPPTRCTVAAEFVWIRVKEGFVYGPRKWPRCFFASKSARSGQVRRKKTNMKLIGLCPYWNRNKAWLHRNRGGNDSDLPMFFRLHGHEICCCFHHENVNTGINFVDRDKRALLLYTRLAHLRFPSEPGTYHRCTIFLPLIDGVDSICLAIALLS